MVAGRRRRSYRLTEAGARALSGKRADWRDFAAIMTAALEGQAMAEPSLITGYLAELSAQLPAPVVEELADGLDQTLRHHLGQGLDTTAAAEAAIAEFGQPQVILAAFTRASPARRAARRLLATGPIVAGCWAAELITSRAWRLASPCRAPHHVRRDPDHRHWPARRRRARRQLPIRQSGRNSGMHRHRGARFHACSSPPLAVPAVAWPLILAATASAVRLTITARTLRAVLTV